MHHQYFLVLRVSQLYSSFLLVVHRELWLEECMSLLCGVRLQAPIFHSLSTVKKKWLPENCFVPNFCAGNFFALHAQRTVKIYRNYYKS